MPDTKLGGACPRDGRDWDSQCGRCGSSLTWSDCGNCDGGFTDHDCGEDTCCCLEPELNVPCGICCGAGGFPLCLSSEASCKKNPLPGRETVERGTVEWFCLGEVANG